MLSITRLPDIASKTCEPDAIAATLKAWHFDGSQDVPRDVLEDQADQLQDHWNRGIPTRRLEFMLGVMVEPI